MNSAMKEDQVPPRTTLAEIERVATELAALAGAEITNALGGILAVRYKGPEEAEQMWQDPVSEVDQRVEELIRSRLAERFPEHDVIGEESDFRPRRGGDFAWAVDPIDGTTNFVNGFPLCGCTIGVLHRGVPVAGAIWCGTSHALHPGIYHASAGGTLRFNNHDVVPRYNPAVRRRLAGVPVPIPGRGGWETRKTGSAAVECAFVAAGILDAARFEQPNLWDVAGGVALVKAAGGSVLVQSGDTWQELERFETSDGDLRSWRKPLIVGRLGMDALTSGFELLAGAG